MAVRVRYLITILLAIAPLLRVYEGLPGMDMAQVFLVAGLFLAFASRNINFEANNEFLFVIGFPEESLITTVDSRLSNYRNRAVFSRFHRIAVNNTGLFMVLL